MNFFHYKKWFFDVYINEGNYIILFISVIKIGWKRYAYLQLYSAENMNKKGFVNKIIYEIPLFFKEESMNSIIFDAGKIEFKENMVELQFHTAELNCQLSFVSDEKNDRFPLLLKISRRSVLNWKPLKLRSTVSGNLQVKSREKYDLFRENGYCDLVESNIFPWNVPVRKLYWGRIQNDACYLSWSVIKGKKDNTVSKMYLIFKDNYFELNETELIIQKEKEGVKFF